MDLSRGVTLIEQLGDGAGFDIDLRSADLALIDSAGTKHAYEIKVRSTPPNPARVEHDLDRMKLTRDDLHVLYVVPHLTASLRATALRNRRVAVAAIDDDTVILDGTEWQRERPTPPTAAPRGRRPWGRLALLRVLIRSDEPRSQTALAEEAGIAQQAVALALPKLAPLGVERRASGWAAVDPGALWDRFMTEYPGPGGLRRRWTGAASLDVQVERATELARAAGTMTLLSGDLAADRQAPMRRPVTAILFASADIDLSSRSTLVDDGDETLTVIVPADQTVFATARAWEGQDAVLTDPVLTAWEVAHSRGADRDDAVAHAKWAVLAERAAQGTR
ncbi:hypothetical protein ACEXOS_001755 [Herbiconiux sp. P16]|uniref:hypothetical protein n=1 Tax=Herbiconiux wuyangfengii TaxID=3342794 RepID=UPI0035B91418